MAHGRCVKFEDSKNINKHHHFCFFVHTPCDAAVDNLDSIMDAPFHIGRRGRPSTKRKASNVPSDFLDIKRHSLGDSPSTSSSTQAHVSVWSDDIGDYNDGLSMLQQHPDGPSPSKKRKVYEASVGYSRPPTVYQSLILSYRMTPSLSGFRIVMSFWMR